MEMKSILQWNLQSYRSKFSELKVILNEVHPICVCLQETMIRNREVFPPSQYNIFTSDITRQDNHERGAAILVNKSVKHDDLQLRTTLQAKAVRIHLKKSYTICSIYLPHIPVTYQDLSDLITQLPTPFVIMGDMNARNPLWHDTQLNEKGRTIEDLMLQFDISVLNGDRPTHYHQQTNSYSVIDLSICSSDCMLDFRHDVIDDLHGSDHFPTQLEIIDNINIADKYEGYNLNKADWSSFFKLTQVRNIELNADIDEATQALTSVLRNAADASIPRKSGKLSRPPVPWWNAQCDDAKRERTRAERALKRNYNVDNKIRYNRAKALCKLVFNECRKQSWLEYLSSINSRTDINSVWKRVRKLSGKFKSQPSPMIIDDQNRLQREPAEVAEVFATFFASVGQLDRNDEFNRYRRREESKRFDMEGDGGEYNDPITMRELNSALSTANESSPGHDDITYSMLKHAHPSLVEAVLRLYNEIFSRRVFPRSWLVSIIIPFAKEGKDPAYPSNYRPISLTCCLCKLLEKIINVRLMWFLEHEEKITPIQSGFRKNRSTTDHIVQLESHIRSSMADNNHLIAVFFDLCKAYDTAWRHGILMKLHQYGIRGHLLYFMRNFLSDRSIRVRINATTSTERQTTEGVPQGSVLSCTCFLVAINDIAYNLPVNVQKSLYVDDLAIYISGKRPATLKRQLQIALNSLERWTHKSGFSFSPVKTATMHICRVRGCLKASPELTMSQVILPHVVQYRYLGMLIDSSLTWRAHITNLKRSCTKTLNLLKCISNYNNGADRKTLLRLYLALLKPKLDYGCEAYDSACQTLLNSLQPVQNAAIRIATGAIRTSPIKSLHADAGLPPLAVYRRTKIVNFYLRINANSDKHVLNSVRVVDGEVYAENGRKPKPYFIRAEEIIRSLNTNIERMMSESVTDTPPWRVRNVTVCLDLLLDQKKSDIPSFAARTIFQAHREVHSTALQLYTDGSKTDHGTAYAFSDQNEIVARKISPAASIYTAEMMAVLNAVRRAVASNTQLTTIFTDSRSVIQGINGYNSKHAIVQEIQQIITNSGITLNLCWVPSHVGVKENEAVDREAREAVEHGILDDCELPRIDVQSKLKKLIRMEWDNEWLAVEENKLREFKQSTKPFSNAYSVNRVWEVKLARLRIGHCRLTHQYLLGGGERPYCEDCIVPLSVKHILIECPSYSDQRRRFFGRLGDPLTLDNILGEGGPVECGGLVNQFLRSVELFSLI